MSANGAMVTRKRSNTGLLFIALLGQFCALIFADSTNSVAATPSLTTLKQATTLSLLSTLPVKGKAPKTGYSREAFSHWRDPDRNGCDARNDILKRDLTDVVFKESSNGCKVVSGVLADPYSGTNIQFTFGRSDVDIDHVVALSHAWQVGAFQWSDEKRMEFANDPLNLLAVSARLNRQKGDGDAATWLPPAKAYRCAYVSRQVVVKVKYGLWITRPEKTAIERVLSTCPNFVAPTNLLN